MNKPTTPLSATRPSQRSSNAKATLLADLTGQSNVKRVNVELSAEHHAKLKIHAIRQNKSIRELLAEYVAGLPD